MSYRDIVWENAMEAYHSSPDPQIEVTPYIAARLDAAKHELLLKANRMKRERDRRMAERRRRMVIVGATTLSVLVSAGATSAVIGVTTGVPAIDEILGVHQAQDPTRGGSIAEGSSVDPEAGSIYPGAPVVDVEIPSEDAAGKPLTGVGFTSLSRRLCYALPSPPESKIRGHAGTLTCQPSGFVAAGLAKNHLVLLGVTSGTHFILSGIAGEDVESIEMRGPDGPLRVNVSQAWDPGLPDLGQVRVFVGVVIADQAGLENDEAATNRSLDLRAYQLKAHLADGRVMTVPAEPLTPPV